jgi:hypothetical protein
MEPEENKNYNHVLYFYIEHPEIFVARSGLDLVAGACLRSGGRQLAPLPSGHPLPPGGVWVCSEAGWWRRRSHRRDTGVVSFSLSEVVGFVNLVYRMRMEFLWQIRVKTLFSVFGRSR